MKFVFAFALLLTVRVSAQDILLKDHNFVITDITRLGITKESIFKSLNTNFIKTKSSICSNRALVWGYDIKREQRINSAKIFLFYTKKSGEVGRKTWWYHVAPIVNEGTNLWVIDRGFPGFIQSPLKPNDWLYKFSGSRNCKEILVGEEDLISRMFVPQTFPEVTQYGRFDCYYKIMPEGYWTPSAVANNMLQRNREGRQVNYHQDEINVDELLVACMEASTTKIGRAFSDPEKMCKEYLGM